MNLHDLGSLADLIAAVATVITLVFVALELRANRKQNKLVMLSGLDHGWSEINAQIAQDEKLASIFNRGLGEPDLLNDEEATRFFFLVAQYINNHVSIWTLLIEEGLPSHHELWIKYDISAGYNLPGIWKVFQAMEPTMPPDFVTFVREQRKTKMEFGDWRRFDA
ncbi:MAG: hypothetical protein RIC85_04705 [Gammaproteobacteria bacterium]